MAEEKEFQFIMKRKVVTWRMDKVTVSAADLTTAMKLAIDTAESQVSSNTELIEYQEEGLEPFPLSDNAGFPTVAIWPADAEDTFLTDDPTWDNGFLYEMLPKSVVKDWVKELPLTQQAVLLLALRGPDGMAKQTGIKPMLHYLRGTVLHAAYPDYDETAEGKSGDFMRGDYEHFNSNAGLFYADIDAYPMHFLMHLIHAAEIIGYHFPILVVRNYWKDFYYYFCKQLHMTPETKEQLNDRLAK